MADTKLSALTAATPAAGDLVYIVQGGNSRRATAQGIANLAPGTNLLYVAATRLLSSSTGDDVVLPLFTSSLAGLVGASGGGVDNFLRADGVWAAPPSSATDLGYTASTRLLSSSTGADVTLPLFTSSLAGLVGASGGGDVNFLRADGVWAAPPSSATDLGYTASTRVLTSSTGVDVTLPLATDALPGLMSAAAQARIEQLGAEDSPSFTGLTITGTAAVEIPHIHGDLAGKVYAHVRNATGVSIAALIPYHVTGSHGDTDVVTIEPAQASNAALMPAAGITYEAIASNASGHGVVAGVMTGVNTSGLTAGDALYVGPGGGLTATRPTSDLVQVVAIVGRVHATTGTIVVALGSPDFTLGHGLTISGSTIFADQVLGIACSDETSNLTAGTAKVTFRMPYPATLLGCKAEVNAAPTGANLVVDINEAGTSILSTKLSIDAGEETSDTAATPPVISDAALANDARITIDIDQIGSTAAGKGLKVWLYLRRTG